MRVSLSSNSLRYFPSLLLVLSSCSVLYDLSPDQCERKSDCAKFGPAYSCDAGICKAPPGSQGGTPSAGGTPSDGGTETSGGFGGASGGLGGKGNGGGGNETSGGSGGAGATAGMGGQGEPPECVTHSDCQATHDDVTDPYACVENTCVPLTSDDCSVVLPLNETPIYKSLMRTDAVIIGAYAYMGTSIGITINNYDLVVKTFNGESGIKSATGGVRRAVVVVVCRNNPGTDLRGTADHLVDVLKVPAIIGALPATDVQDIFDYKAHANNVFLITPNYADETLISYADDNLIWHMLSGASYLGVSYKPLLDLTLTHLRNLPAPAPLGPTEDARVQLVTVNDERFLQDLGTTIRDTIQFNGMSATANANAAEPLFNSVATTSWATDEQASQTEMISSVVSFRPHVIIGSNAHEMYGAIPEIERQWPTTQARPFYLLSPFVYNQLGYLGTGLSDFPGLRQRILGVNFPAAEDPELYDVYQSEFNLAYPDRPGQSAGYENFYDATYYLMYAMGAAWEGIDAERGAAIAKGMERITDVRSTNEFNVGDNIQGALSLLEQPNNRYIRLIGAMGPPNWDLTGARKDIGSVFCIGSDERERADVLRYNVLTSRLEGTVPCFTFPAPAP